MIKSKYVGFCDYSEGLRHHKEGATGVIYGFEHPSAITLGVRGNTTQDLVFGEELTRKKGFQLAHVDRGGHATLHNPGQLVIYPKVHLPTLGLSVRDFVCVLQKTTVALLARHGLSGECGAEPGIYVDGKKIAALGLRIHKGTVHHGLAINVSNDLSEFQWILPCGVRGAQVTSLQALGLNVLLEPLFFQWAEAFGEQLSLTQLRPNSKLSASQDNLRI